MTATAFACLIGLPLGALVATSRFPGRSAALVAMNAPHGLPPVVVGLMVYLYLSRSGPLGFLGLLYTPTAMIIAQTILIAPIVAALSRQVLGRPPRRIFRAVPLALSQPLADRRGAFVGCALFAAHRGARGLRPRGRRGGRVIIVGGNIDHLTRVMTTAIALETSKGDLALALALGIVLLGHFARG